MEFGTLGNTQAVTLTKPLTPNGFHVKTKISLLPMCQGSAGSALKPGYTRGGGEYFQGFQ